MKDTIDAIIMNHLGLTKPPLASDRIVADLDADSLHEVEIVMFIEEEFGIEIGDADAAGFKTVGDIHDYVARCIENHA